MAPLPLTAIQLTRRQSWIAFSRAFTQRQQQRPYDDDSGLSGAAAATSFGGRLRKRRGVDSQLQAEVGVEVADAEEESKETSEASTMQLQRTPASHTRHSSPILFHLLDRLSLGAHLNQRQQRQKKTLAEVQRERKEYKQAKLSVDIALSASSSMHPRIPFTEIGMAFKRHDRKRVRETLERIPPRLLFRDVHLVNMLIQGMMQTRDIKTLCFYLDNLAPEVRMSDEAFIALLNGVPNSRQGVTKHQRDQGRARRSTSLPAAYSEKIATYDYNRLAVLINDVKPTQQALINTLPILALQNGNYILPQHSKQHPLNTDVALACLRWLLRTGYDESAAEFVETVLDVYKNDSITRTAFGLHALNLFLKSLSNSHGDPAGPKFVDKYRPHKFYKTESQESQDGDDFTLSRCQHVIDFFCSRIPTLRLSALTHSIMDRVKKRRVHVT